MSIGGRIREWRNNVIGAWRGLAFTTIERRAIQVLIAMILIGSTLRYLRERRLAEGLTLIASEAAADSVQRSQETSPSLSGQAASREAIDLNRADATDLESLPGIGPKKAALILELRSRRGGFRSVDELKDVKGIGAKTLERLKPLVTLGRVE
ncbi:MAG: ComEA family DNA-binding protein [Calditrichaeota bacterium]|nr:ComEA family DNA-binding protein [Calditrichota bacterium]